MKTTLAGGFVVRRGQVGIVVEFVFPGRGMKGRHCRWASLATTRPSALSSVVLRGSLHVLESLEATDGLGDDPTEVKHLGLQTCRLRSGELKAFLSVYDQSSVSFDSFSWDPLETFTAI